MGYVFIPHHVTDLNTHLKTAVMLVREDPTNWPESLKEKMRPHADEELLQALDEAAG